MVSYVDVTATLWEAMAVLWENYGMICAAHGKVMGRDCGKTLWRMGNVMGAWESYGAMGSYGDATWPIVVPHEKRRMTKSSHRFSTRRPYRICVWQFCFFNI